MRGVECENDESGGNGGAGGDDQVLGLSVMMWMERSQRGWIASIIAP